MPDETTTLKYLTNRLSTLYTVSPLYVPSVTGCQYKMWNLWAPPSG